MSGEWPEKIRTMLEGLLGAADKKAVAYETAVEIDRLLPSGTRNAEAFAAIVRRLFETWVYYMRYLAVPEAIDHQLPESVLRSDIEVAQEYGLKTQKGIEEKQAQIAAASERRVERALEHLAAGWEPYEVVGFVASKAEWRQVLRRAGRAAA